MDATILGHGLGVDKYFKGFKVEQINREKNAHADALASLASACMAFKYRTITFGSIEKMSFEVEQEVLAIEFGPSYLNEIISYLKDDVLPKDRKEAFRVRNKAIYYWLSKSGKLYHRSYTEPYLLVVHSNQVASILDKLHSESCSCHSSGQSLAHRAISQGYWWKGMKKDCDDVVKKCKPCQLFSPVPKQPTQTLSPILSPWPFAQWGLDIVGKLSIASGGFMFLITAIDYFSKWVEAEPLVTTTEADIRKFVLRNIVTRLGVPYAIVSNNGSQFVGKELTSLCEEFGILFFNSTSSYPQRNGQAEASNKTVCAGIK